MGARQMIAIATVALAAASLSGCVLPPQAVPPDAPTSAQPSTPTPLPTPSATPAPSAPPTSTPAPTTASLGLAVEDGECSQSLIEALAYAYDPATFEPAFPAPEVLDGFDVGCEGRQPSGADAESFALVPVEQVDQEAVRARLLAMGMTEDSLAPGFFDFAQPGTGSVSVQLLTERLQSLAAPGTFGDEADWVVFTWYEIGTA